VRIGDEQIEKKLKKCPYGALMAIKLQNKSETETNQLKIPKKSTKLI